MIWNLKCRIKPKEKVGHNLPYTHSGLELVPICKPTNPLVDDLATVSLGPVWVILM